MDLEKVKQLLAFMEEHDLAEIEIEEEGSKVRLRKNSPTPVGVAPAAVATPGALLTNSGAPAAGETAKPKDTVEITSPMVGTFYRAPAPEAEPFVSVGQEVNEDTVVCIIEAMKVMNEITAKIHGEVVAVLVETGEPVEFGQPLMLVKPAGGVSAPPAP